MRLQVQTIVSQHSTSTHTVPQPCRIQKNFKHSHTSNLNFLQHFFPSHLSKRSPSHFWRRQLGLRYVLLIQSLRIFGPVQIFSRVESVEDNHRDDYHTVIQSVNGHGPCSDAPNLHSFQNHKIRLLLHQRAAPPPSKLDDAIDASDFDEQPRRCQSTQEVNQALVVFENYRCSCRSLWVAVDTKCVFCGENGK